MAEPVSIKDIPSARLRKIIAEMRDALDSQDDGVAIAAPQIGYPLRIFIISEKVAEIIGKEKRKKNTKRRNTTGENRNDDENKDIYPPLPHTVFINPIIKKFSRESQQMEEGCLSVRYLYGRVKRAKKAEVEAYDENGKKFAIGGSGLLAQIFQHEVDHLNGILFIDKATDLENVPPERTRRRV